jgi:hypothetical protein
MMQSWCRQVNWGNRGIPWVNCAVLYVKDDLKGRFWGLRFCLSKLHSLLGFSVRYDVTQYNCFAPFNWECIGRLKCCSACVTWCRNFDVGNENRAWLFITRNACMEEALLRKLVVTRIMKKSLAFCRPPRPARFVTIFTLSRPWTPQTSSSHRVRYVLIVCRNVWVSISGCSLPIKLKGGSSGSQIHFFSFLLLWVYLVAKRWVGSSELRDNVLVNTIMIKINTLPF